MNSPEYDFLLKRVAHLTERLEDMDSKYTRSVGKLIGEVRMLTKRLNNLQKNSTGRSPRRVPGVTAPGTRPGRAAQ